ncbi:MAG: DUF3093 domain-containing protein [Bowdeniella nasicola]|nr:DUF3093 domain-containing protein [Bowdeniella nasicola]
MEPYATRYYPTVPLVAVMTALGASFGLIFVPTSRTLALIVAIVGAILVLGLLLASAPLIEVRDGELHAGGAHIPLRYLRDPKALDEAELRRLMGTDADLRAWVVHRPWAKSAVRVRVEDPRDPTPYWLLCVKDPHQLVRVLHESTRSA